jgi:pimeloyl-ACP methyl ester carboxylesterase
MVAATSADGTEVIHVDQGTGPVLLILHGGLSDESTYDKVAAKLTDRFAWYECGGGSIDWIFSLTQRPASPGRSPPAATP